MRIVTCLALAMFLFGCGQDLSAKDEGTPVSVGMAYEDAEPILTAAGGMHVDIDGIQDTDTHILEVNRFPNGTVVLIEISHESKSITGLKVCVDADQPADSLEWKIRQAFCRGID